MKKIYINPGHSDRDPGAVGHKTERWLNVAVSMYMDAYLRMHYLCQTRITPGTMDDLMEVCRDANQWGADLFVSNHFNAGGGDGYEGYVYNESRVPLAQTFAKHVEAVGQNLRSSDIAPGVKIQSGYIVLKYTDMPAIITEGAFVDKQQDIADWDEDRELEVLGFAYAKAVAEFLGLERKKKPEYLVHYRTQLGPFKDKRIADNLLEALKATGHEATITEKEW